MVGKVSQEYAGKHIHARQILISLLTLTNLTSKIPLPDDCSVDVIEGYSDAD